MRASGCTSRCSQRCRAATISQVSSGGGEKEICGSLPMLTSCTGAGVPHSLPSRTGSCGSTTRSRPLSSSPQRARAASMSSADHRLAAARRLARLAQRQRWARRSACRRDCAPGRLERLLRRCNRPHKRAHGGYGHPTGSMHARTTPCIGLRDPDVTPHTNQNLEPARLSYHALAKFVALAGNGPFARRCRGQPVEGQRGRPRDEHRAHRRPPARRSATLWPHRRRRRHHRAQPAARAQRADLGHARRDRRARSPPGRAIRRCMRR